MSKDYFLSSLFTAAMFFTTIAGMAGLVVMADYLDGKADNNIEALDND